MSVIDLWKCRAWVQAECATVQKEGARTCIIFIDEIERSVARGAGSVAGMTSRTELKAPSRWMLRVE